MILREADGIALVLALLGACHELMQLLAERDGCIGDDEVRDTSTSS